jgi:hypothetical protein
MPVIEFEMFNAEGDANVCRLPATYAVCSDCEGEGMVMNESMRHHAYAQEEFEETFWEDEDREQYFRRGGIYDVQCPTCGGKRVEAVVDRAACERDPELNALLFAYDEKLTDEARYERERAAERRMGA